MPGTHFTGNDADNITPTNDVLKFHIKKSFRAQRYSRRLLIYVTKTFDLVRGIRYLVTTIPAIHT